MTSDTLLVLACIFALGFVTGMGSGEINAEQRFLANCAKEQKHKTDSGLISCTLTIDLRE